MRRFLAGAAALALLAIPPLHGLASAMRQYPILDPVLKMTAWTLTVPAGWTVAGTMMPGSSCNGSTTPIFKATSPDGKTGAYFLPRVDWAWGPGVRPAADCLPWTSAVSAKDFLAYQVRVDGVGFVSAQPPAPKPAMPPGWTSDTARYLVRYSVGSQQYDAILNATVTCHAATMLGAGVQHGCSALVTRWFAPAGKALPDVPAFEAMKLALNQQWMSAWTAAMVSRTTRLYAAETQAALAQGRLAADARMQEHQQYMAAAQRSADLRDQQFVAGQYKKQNNNDNFVDYVLDCQRSYDGNVRVSSANCPNRQTF